MEVELVGRADLDSALPDWAALHAADPTATPFQAPGWGEAWLRRMGRHKEVTGFLDAVWPAVTAEELVFEVLSTVDDGSWSTVAAASTEPCECPDSTTGSCPANQLVRVTSSGTVRSA